MNVAIPGDLRYRNAQMSGQADKFNQATLERSERVVVFEDVGLIHMESFLKSSRY